MRADAKTTTVYGEAVDKRGWRVRVLGVNGCRPAIQHRRFVSIEISNDENSVVKGVDLDPVLLFQVLGALERACKAETR